MSAGRAILTVAVVVAAYFLVVGAFNSIRAHQLGQQRSQVHAEISELQSRYQRLQALKEYLDSDEYVEAVAREQLGLVREGETGFVIISTAPREEADSQSELWWDILIR